jgi:hypothetical protein
MPELLKKKKKQGTGREIRPEVRHNQDQAARKSSF